MSMVKSLIFTPASWIWDRVYRFRRSLYNTGVLKQNFFELPIFSVGNITFGGTGKTPFTIWLSEYLEQKGVVPLVLTRGYKGGLEHGSGLIRGQDSFKFNPVSYGDEALLIARKLQKGAVAVGKNRSQNLNLYFNRILPDAVILDDGFQHLKIHRNLNFVLFDCLMPLSRYQVAPQGYLREGLSALKDAHIVLFSRVNQVSKMKFDSLKRFLAPYLPRDILFVGMSYKPTGIFNWRHKKVYNLDEIHQKKVVAVVALGSPASFFQSLESLGLTIVDRFIFPDHHYYTQEELQKILESARQQDALILTSEKDIVKIQRVSRDLKAHYLGIDIKFEFGENELKDRIDGTLIC